MKKRLLLILFLISLGFNIGLVTWISVKKTYHETIVSGCQMGLCNWRQSPLRHELNLTTLQIEKLETAFQELQNNIKPLQDELQKKRAALAAFLKTDPVSSQELDQLINAITMSQGAIERHYILHFLQIKPLLNENQQRRMHDCLEKCFCPAIGAALPKLPKGCEQSGLCGQTVCCKAGK